MNFTNPSPLIGSMRSPQNVMPVDVGGIQNQYQNQYQRNMSPEQWEYVQQVRRTGYDPNMMPQVQQPQQPEQSDPYNDFITEFNQCSNVVQASILENPEFKQCMAECDKKIQATMEALVRPQVMQTQDGRVAFERLLASFRGVRDQAKQQEAQNMQRIQALMNDDVVRKRIEELEKNK